MLFTFASCKKTYYKSKRIHIYQWHSGSSRSGSLPPSSSKPSKSSNNATTSRPLTTPCLKDVSKETSSRNRKLTRHKTITTVPSRFARFSSGLGGGNKRKIGVLNNSAESILQPDKKVQPISNVNVPSSSSSIKKLSAPSDFNDITPFGGLTKTGSNILHRNSWKNNRPGVSSNRWPFLHWSHRKQSPSNTPNLKQEPDSREERHTIESKHPSGVGYSLLSGRKSKNRHISCPDISSASSESSRSTSPTSFKSSLTSLFHRTHSSPSTILATATSSTATSSLERNPKSSGSVMSRPLIVSSGGNILQRRGSNQGKRQGSKLTSSSSSRPLLQKSQSQGKYSPRKEHSVSIEVQEHHSSISDENEILQATVLYSNLPDALDNYLTGHYAATEAESLYAGVNEQTLGESIDGHDLYPENLSSYDLHNVGRYNSRNAVVFSLSKTNYLCQNKSIS